MKFNFAEEEGEHLLPPSAGLSHWDLGGDCHHRETQGFDLSAFLGEFLATICNTKRQRKKKKERETKW